MGSREFPVHKSKLKAIYEDIIPASIDDSNAHEIFKVALKRKSEGLKVAAFRQLKESFATVDVDLDDDLMEDPEELQKIVDTRKKLNDDARKCLADCVAKAQAKKRRLN